MGRADVISRPPAQSSGPSGPGDLAVAPDCRRTYERLGTLTPIAIDPGRGEEGPTRGDTSSA